MKILEDELQATKNELESQRSAFLNQSIDMTSNQVVELQAQLNQTMEENEVLIRKHYEYDKMIEEFEQLDEEKKSLES